MTWSRLCAARRVIGEADGLLLQRLDYQAPRTGGAMFALLENRPSAPGPGARHRTLDEAGHDNPQPERHPPGPLAIVPGRC